MGDIVGIKRKVWVRVYHEQHRQVLLARRSNKVRNPGEWNFMGGNMGQDENPDTAAARELYEETGIKETPVFDFSIRVRDRMALVYFYTVTFRYFKVPSLNHEHDSFGWFSKDAALTLPLHFYTQLFFAQPKSVRKLKQ